MGTETKTIHTCDRCGIQSEDKFFQGGSQMGNAVVHLKGYSGGKSYDGAWGGSGYAADALLCFTCAEKFRAMLDTFLAEDD